MSRLRNLLELIVGTFWFVPSLITIGAIAFSYATVQLDQIAGEAWATNVGWLWAGGADGAREVLSTIAGSMITVAGVTFSITIVSLTLAASQYGSRLLRTFMRDTGNQAVLGTLIGTFVYCLLVLRTVRTEEPVFIPYLSVNVGLLFAIASLGVLIYFIHHITSSLQAENLVAGLARDLNKLIDRDFPRGLGQPEQAFPEALDGGDVPDFERASAVLPAARSGYIQTVDSGRLLRLAKDRDVVLELRHKPGDFVKQGTILVRLWPGQKYTRVVGRAIDKAFVIGHHRTPTQDILHLLQQIVEIAIRSLSQGVNNPFTAMTCLDWLSASLTLMAERDPPPRYRYDESGRLRAITNTVSFADVADTVFTEFRQHGVSNLAVVRRSFQALAVVGERTKRPADRNNLRGHAELLRGDALAAMDNRRDREAVEEAYQEVLGALASGIVASPQGRPGEAQGTLRDRRT